MLFRSASAGRDHDSIGQEYAFADQGEDSSSSASVDVDFWESEEEDYPGGDTSGGDPWQSDSAVPTWKPVKLEQGYERTPVRYYGTGDDDSVQQAVLGSCHPEQFLPEEPHPMKPKVKSVSLDEFPFGDMIVDSSEKNADAEPQCKEDILPSAEDEATNRQTKGSPGHEVTHETPMPVGCGEIGRAHV